MSRYNFKETEGAWQALWAERRCFAAQEDAGRPQVLRSGDVSLSRRGASIWGTCATTRWATCVARYKRASGFNVPASDGLGRLRPAGRERRHAERRSIRAKWTYDNIATMRAQLKSMGLSLDWARELATCDPDYYRQQQAMFLDLLRGRPGLSQGSQRQLGPGRPDRARQRAGDRRPRLALRRASVEQRKLTQWFFKITAYSEELLAGAARRSTAGPRRCALMQENWIGRSEGAAGVRFKLTPTAEQTGWRSSPPGRTRCSGPRSSRSPPIIRWPPSSPRRIPGSPTFIEECRQDRDHVAERIETAEKMGYRHRAAMPSIRSIRAGSCRSMSPISC